MARRTRPVRLHDGRTVRLTPGEINAIKRYAKMWGTSTSRDIFDPGFVRYDTVFNLVTKGLMVRTESGVHRWAEGVWA